MYGLEPTQLLEDKRLSPINDHLTRGLLAVSSCRLLHICEVSGSYCYSFPCIGGGSTVACDLSVTWLLYRKSAALQRRSQGNNSFLTLYGQVEEWVTAARNAGTRKFSGTCLESLTLWRGWARERIRTQKILILTDVHHLHTK